MSCSGTPRHLARRSPGIEPATFLLPDNCSYLLSYCRPYYYYHYHQASIQVTLLTIALAKLPQQPASLVLPDTGPNRRPVIAYIALQHDLWLIRSHGKLNPIELFLTTLQSPT